MTAPNSEDILPDDKISQEPKTTEKVDIKTAPIAVHNNQESSKNPTKPSTVSTSKSKTKSQPKTTDQPDPNQRFQNVTCVLLSITLVASIASLGYCIYDHLWKKEATYSNSFIGGNLTDFTKGTITEIAAKVTPGVVSVLTEVNSRNIFGQSTTSTAAGTGMIVTADGYVLTNKHVIDGAKTIQVVLDDGTTYKKVSVVATDPLNDVAFLKIKDVNDLPTVTLGDSKTIVAGQEVIAIGNALGQFQNTITSGIISGTGRLITASSEDYSTSESLNDMIQTDAAINSGNSGGPLVNAAGEVIGINTATSADADGIGFAIPISSVKGMLKQLVEKGTTDRSYLGLYYINITPDIADTYNLPVSSGAYAYTNNQSSAVVSGSPADKAGLKDKDIIVKVNGIKVGASGSVSSLLGEYAPGETVELTIIRDGKETPLKVTLGKYEADK